MKYILIILTAISLTGCFGPPTLDTSSLDAFKQSLETMKEDLPAEKRENLNEAITYYSIGGSEGLEKLVMMAFNGEAPGIDDLLKGEISTLNGLTAEQILEKYEPIKIKAEERAQRIRDFNRWKDEVDALVDAEQFDEALDKARAMIEAMDTPEFKERAEPTLDYVLWLKDRSTLKSFDDRIRDALEEDDPKAAFKLANEMMEALSVEGVRESAQYIYGRAEEAHQAYIEFQEYLPKVKINEFVARRIDTYREDGVPAVRISAKNEGDRTVNRLVVRVYFKDSTGGTIFEDDFTVATDSSYNFKAYRKPLKPGYVAEMPKDRYFTLDTPISTWEEGSAEYEIVELELAD
jgi:hypothetical protein